ncbi:MAG: ABC transporter ATP-binding protein [Deltaproteobacteria bacterium]|nr:ABC transporter ATP-binding protein [Deltaproteobacteria bacterium]
MIRLIDIHKHYSQGRNEVTALAGLSLDIPKGEFAVVMGPSGSGKSTLLHLIGGLDRPTQGQVLVDGRIISQMADDDVTLFRRAKIGFVFQFFNLLPTLTALENVMLPLILDGRAGGDSLVRARILLERVDLKERRDHLPEELSGGEMQRLAVARALAFNPPILLADEPTGNLDSKNGEAILTLMRQINREDRCTVVMVTHDREAASYGDRVVHLRDGVIEGGKSQ